MTDVTEIAADVFRISTFIPSANLQFNQFLVRDEEPLLFHTGLRGLMFDETEAVLLCSDLFHQEGRREPMTEWDVVGRFKETLLRYQQGPMANYLPYTCQTEPTLQRLAALKPRVLATMHGSTFLGDGAQALHDSAAVMREVLGVA